MPSPLEWGEAWVPVTPLKGPMPPLYPPLEDTLRTEVPVVARIPRGAISEVAA